LQPNLTSYPEAKFPGVVCFSEIYQVTAPVKRFAASIASQGYIVACPAVYHEFPGGSEAYAYDEADTDRGNANKEAKLLKNYDDDIKCTIDYLTSLPNCNGRIGSTGMCLGGHIAFRAAFDPRVLATQAYFPTDIHSETLGSPGASDSLQRAQEIQGELVLIFGLDDNHVPFEGRTLIRARLNDLGTRTSFLELPAAHAFIRDESSKGRYDSALSRLCFHILMDLFDRNLARELGPKSGKKVKVADVC